jgi:hypothetical protein
MIDDILTEYYEDCKPEPCEFGHLYHAATEHPPEELKLWRPSGYDNNEAKSYATTFGITKPTDDAFRRRYPLSNPRLATNEEFIVTVSKPRPVLMLLAPRAIDEAQRKGMGTIWRPLCLIAPIFSLEFPHTGNEKFSASFVERMRKLEFPQLMFLPKYKAALSVDSFARLNECRSVSINALQPLSVSLSEPVRNLLRSQLLYLMGDQYEGDYHVYRELIRDGVA